MKWFKENWFQLVMIGTIILLTYFLFKSCHSSGPGKDYKRENDSLKTVIQKVEMASKRSVDSLEQTNKDFFAIIETNDLERSKIIHQLASVKNKAEKYRQQLKTSVDTMEKIVSCDSLADNFDQYILLSAEDDKRSDSIIATQKSVISNLDSINILKSFLASEFKAALETSTSSFDNLYKDYTKALKKNQWNKIKEKGMLAILIAGGIKIFIDSIKK